jgi:ferredoxin-NADP reductase
MAMIRPRAVSVPSAAARLIYSSRTWEEIIYRDELKRLAG